jgi:hypothetical protein
MLKMMNPDWNPMDEINNQNQKEFNKDDIKMPTSQVQEDSKNLQTKETKSLEEKIIIPGLTDKKKEDKENAPKKPLIMEMEPEKYTPNFKINRFTEDGQDKI